MSKPCTISGTGHTWNLAPFEKYISRGTCDCGAVRFFSDTFETKSIERAELLNNKKGKEGREMSDTRARALAKKHGQTIDNIIKKEVIMAEYQDMNFHERGRYIKEHLAEIVEDIKVMTDAKVMEKWGFKVTTCLVLRRKHAPETVKKYKTRKPRPEKTATKPEKRPSPETSPLTEHERYLVLLGYQQAVREFLKYLK